ncbi:N-acetyl-gamma-glutamyl-phosphate reductase [Saccharothrix variisporea]|uniref:N-acetyl-gamma-glutamyl-phosphate reductase n=1 Tax=Saccharothrix variisporea TaxID=543527 RepID=UPI001B85E95F|nr:N-acetyl-gamma-glutamyl-phosphate reductase [Saccharothrix variisporea]
MAESARAGRDGETGKVRVAVVGATGYTGAELVRLLLDHPHVELAFLSSERSAGKPVDRVLSSVRNHPAAAGLKLRPLAELSDVDMAFGCLPGGELPGRMPLLAERAKHVVNLAGDFRLTDPVAAARHYPGSASWTEPFSYHVPEFGEPGERFLNLPGCMAVTSIYALYPLLAEGLVEPDPVVDAKTGSSGSGRTSTEHPADRFGNFRAHKPHGHRHGPEVAQALRSLTGVDVDLQFSTHSLDVARGILVTAYSRLRSGVSEVDVKRAYVKAYRRTPFVRVRNHGLPALKTVVGSNVAEVAPQVQGDRCVTIAALDNLVKGAAGQAVQTLNQVFGLPEHTGLPFTAVAP